MLTKVLKKLNIYKNNKLKQGFLNKNPENLFFEKGFLWKFLFPQIQVNYDKIKCNIVTVKRIAFCKIVYYIELTVLATLPIRTASQGESFAYIAFLRLFESRKGFFNFTI